MHSKRYDRQMALPEIGISGQQKLQDARVLVIGAGGLGCPVLQNLAAAGVGKIGIIDGDLVEETNLHRQFLYTGEDIGENKANVAAAAALRQNPKVEVRAFASHFTAANAFEIISDYQILVDCTDNQDARYLINDVALVKNIPFVYASIHKFEGQLSVFNFEAGPTYRCLFPQKNGFTASDCNDSGVVGVLPSMLGVLQATEVLKIILGIGKVASGKLLLYDGLQHTFQTIGLEKNPEQIRNGLLNGLALQQSGPKIAENINAADFYKMAASGKYRIIDIRENYEEPKLAIPAIENIPLSELEIRLHDNDKNQKIIVICQYGNKSRLATNYLMKNGFRNLFQLQHGIESLHENDFIK